jgi:hypothetical protein
MTTLVTRAQWGARPRKAGTTSIDPTEGVTVHYEGGGFGWPWEHSSCDDKVRAMQADHMDNRGWSDIAYNYLGCPHDYLYEGRGYDRRSSANGYERANEISFAVQGIWGDQDGVPPDNLKRAIRYGIDILRSKGGASDKLHGHRDWKSTSCPGDYLYAWVKQGCPLPASGDVDMTTDASVRKIIQDEASLEGGSIHEVVQNMAIANNEYVRQMKDDFGNYAAAATDASLKDDFAKLSLDVQRIADNQGNMQTTLQAILNKLNNPPA